MIGASLFEDYLLEQGFIPYVYGKKGWEPYKGTNISYSSMGVCSLCYKKENKEVYYGLHEHGHPPCLMYPRPKIRIKKLRDNESKKGIIDTLDEIYNYEDESISIDMDTIKELNLYKYKIVDESFDSSIDVLFQRESIETIFKSLWNESIIFTYDID